MPKRTFLVLTPLQSIRIHGWLNPKRILTWDDVVKSDNITVQKLVESAGFTQAMLVELQPDIHEWITHKYVSYDDVPYMVGFPLDPITHLHGDISTLVTYNYGCHVLLKIGLTFRRLKQLHIDARWMKMLNMTLREWVTLGLTIADVNAMTDGDVLDVFGACKTTVNLSVGMSESFLTDPD